MSFPEMRDRLDKELEKFSAMINKNSDLIKNMIRNDASTRKNNSTQNNIIGGNTKAISDALTLISGNSEKIDKNLPSISENTKESGRAQQVLVLTRLTQLNSHNNSTRSLSRAIRSLSNAISGRGGGR